MSVPASLHVVKGVCWSDLFCGCHAPFESGVCISLPLLLSLVQNGLICAAACATLLSCRKQVLPAFDTDAQPQLQHNITVLQSIDSQPSTELVLCMTCISAAQVRHVVWCLALPTSPGPGCKPGTSSHEVSVPGCLCWHLHQKG